MQTRRLNKELVLQTAVDLANEQGGLETVTLAQLAEALDVRSPSLYNHVDGLDGLHLDLRLRAGRALMAELRAASFGLTGADALRAMAGATRRFAHEQPALYPLTVIAPDPHEPEAQALADELLQMLLLVMASMGLSGSDALHAIRGYRAVVHGFVALEAAGGFKMDLDTDASFARLLDTYLGGL
jgi:AcrR family transcriptional regulator